MQLPMFSLENKNAVITGAGSGIGKSIALVFAKQQAVVHIIDLNKKDAEDATTEIERAGGKAFAYGCTVVDQKQVTAVFQQIGHLDILVNSAGISHIGKAHTTSETDLDHLYQVNIKGVYNCLYAAIPLMLQQG